MSGPKSMGAVEPDVVPGWARPLRMSLRLGADAGGFVGAVRGAGSVVVAEDATQAPHEEEQGREQQGQR